ncbi:MAG: hypothetical protein D6776_01930, partial [Planctomycetota bacterium]
ALGAFAPERPGPTRDDLATLLARGVAQRTAVRYRCPSEDELRLFEAAFAALLPGASSDLSGRAVAALRRLGFEVVGGRGWLAVRERAGCARGAGIYVLRRVRASERGVLVLQAPHRFFDEGTGRLARALFAAGVGDLLMLNTVHRHAVRGEGGSDLAHAERSFFQAATRAVTARSPRGVVLQLHGFSAARHRGLSRGSAVLSAGTRSADAPTLRLLTRLRRVFAPRSVGLYGREVRTLGGTSNVQGRWVRSRAGWHFVHLELESALRRDLLASKALRSGLERAIRGALGGEPTGPSSGVTVGGDVPSAAGEGLAMGRKGERR